MKDKQYVRAQELIRQFVGIQRELFDMGLVLTAAHMGKTVDQMGWELAEHSEKDGRITDNERHRRAWAAEQRHRA